MKRVLCLLFVIITLLISFASCGGGNTPQNSTTPATGDAPTENAATERAVPEDFDEKVEAVKAAVRLAENIEFFPMADLTLKTTPALKKLKEEVISEKFTLFYTRGASFDEIGILFVQKPDNVEKCLSIAKEYIKSRADDALYRSYFPGEESKLDDAEARAYGNYVVYAMLDKDNRAAFFAKVEELLKP